MLIGFGQQTIRKLLIGFDRVLTLQKFQKIQSVQLSVSDLHGHGPAQGLEMNLISASINDSTKRPENTVGNKERSIGWDNHYFDPSISNREKY